MAICVESFLPTSCAGLPVISHFDQMHQHFCAMSLLAMYWLVWQQKNIPMGMLCLVCSIQQFVQSGLKTGGRESRFENCGSWVLIVQQKEALSTGFRVSSPEFLLKYTQICLFLKSPIWKVFHIDPTTTHPKIWGSIPLTPRIDSYGWGYGFKLNRNALILQWLHFIVLFCKRHDVKCFVQLNACLVCQLVRWNRKCFFNNYLNYSKVCFGNLTNDAWWLTIPPILENTVL